MENGSPDVTKLGWANDWEFPRKMMKRMSGMFEIQGRLKTIRKEAIRKWGSNPSNA